MKNFSDNTDLSELLSNQDIVKLNNISAARNEDPVSVLNRFGIERIRSAPKSFSRHIPLLRKMQFDAIEIRDSLAYVALPNGRVFYGFQSNQNHKNAFEYVKDTIPKNITAETFLLAIDVAQRYISSFSWMPSEIMPPLNGTIVECGAYLGHKTIYMVDELVGPKGKILAIEMMPDNVEILRRNIVENNLESVIEVAQCGVWQEAGIMKVHGKGRQRNSLVELDKLSEAMIHSVKVDTLDNLIQKHDLKIVDLIFMTINGAELGALKGLNRYLDRVKAMFIASLYTINGQSVYKDCAELVKKKGLEVLSSSTDVSLFIKNNKF